MVLLSSFPPQLVQEAPLLRDLRGIWTQEWSEGKKAFQQFLPVSSVRVLTSNIPAFLSTPGCLAGDLHGASRGRRLRRGFEGCFGAWGCCPRGRRGGSRWDYSKWGCSCVTQGSPPCLQCWRPRCAPFDPRPPPTPAQHPQPCPSHPIPCPRLLRALGILCCFLQCLLEREYINMFPSAAPFRSQRYVWYPLNSTPYQKYIVLEANRGGRCQPARNAFAIVWGVKFPRLFSLEDLEGWENKKKKNCFTSGKRARRSKDDGSHLWDEDGGVKVPKDILRRKRTGIRTNIFFLSFLILYVMQTVMFCCTKTETNGCLS